MALLHFLALAVIAQASKADHRVEALVREYDWNKGLVGELSRDNYQVVYPFQIRDKTRLGIDTRNYYYTNESYHYESATFVIRSGSGRMKMHLRKNLELVPGGARFADIPSGGTRRLLSSASRPENCFYQGQVQGSAASAVALSTCNGLRGVIFTDNQTLLLIPLRGGDLSKRHPHILLPVRWSRGMVCGNGEGTEWSSSGLGSRRSSGGRRYRRDTRASQKYLELAVVADYAMSAEWDFDVWELSQWVLEAANLADLVFQQNLRTRISVVYVEAWTKTDLVPLSDSITAATLNFNHYAARYLATQPHDAALFLMREKLARKESAMGISGAICSERANGVISAGSKYLPHETGALMVHSLAHILGLGHDDDTCTCPHPGGCIMSPTIGSRKSSLRRAFSECSRRAFWEGLESGIGRCLFNRPLEADALARCGDGVLGPGEECDCGGLADCQDPCCDPVTCHLRAFAECAQGACCTQACRIRPAGSLCRSAVSGEPCDVAEHCDGKSGQCPPDAVRQSGSDCRLRGEEGRCWDGRCLTPSRQCQRLWGPEATVAVRGCFEKFNVMGSQYGHCGNSSRTQHRPCELSNVECGVLFCQGGEERARAKSAGGYPLTLRTEIQEDGVTWECKAVLESPEGLVWEGGVCGSGGACLRRACAPLADVLPQPGCPSNNVALACSGHGYCTTGGWCECRKGWAGRQCAEQREREWDPEEGAQSGEDGPVAAPAAEDVDVVSLLIILGGVAGSLLLLLIFTLLCYRRRSSSALEKKKLSRLAAEADHFSESSLDTAQRSIKFGNMPSYRDEKRRNKRVLHKIHEVSDERDSLSNKSGLSSKSGLSNGSALHIPAPPSVPSPQIPPERGILKRRDSEEAAVREPLLVENAHGLVSSSGDGGYESEPPLYSAYHLFERSLRKLDEYEPATSSGQPLSARSPGDWSSASARRQQIAALMSPPSERCQRPFAASSSRSGYATDTEVAYHFTPRSARRPHRDDPLEAGDTSPSTSVASSRGGGLGRPQPIQQLRNIELLLRQLGSEAPAVAASRATDSASPASSFSPSEAEKAAAAAAVDEVGSRTESQASPPSSAAFLPPGGGHLRS